MLVHDFGYIDACNLYKITKRVKGLPSNSSSPSDTWIVDLVDDVHEAGKPVKSVFLKYFIDPTIFLGISSRPIPLPRNAFLGAKGLLYEQKIYLKVSDLIYSGVCDNFVKIYDIGSNCSLSSLQNMLTASGFDKNTARVNLFRNLHYMINNPTKRPSIESNKTLALEDFTSISLDNFCHFTLNEVMDPSNTLSFRQFCEKVNYDLNEVMYALFEQTYACHAMCMNGIAHNDLHMGNSYVCMENEPVRKIYVFNHKNNKFTYNAYETRYSVKVFDFDRAYNFDLGVNDNQSSELEQLNNQVIPIKDIMKTFCELYNYYKFHDIGAADELLDVLVYDSNISSREREKRKEVAKDMMKSRKKCLGIVSDDVYEKINTSYENILLGITKYMEGSSAIFTTVPKASDLTNICVEDMFDGTKLNKALVETTKSSWNSVLSSGQFGKSSGGFWSMLTSGFGLFGKSSPAPPTPQTVTVEEDMTLFSPDV